MSSSSSRSWECAFPGCGRKFARKEHLNRHSLAHNPEHQYKCHTCGRSYARSDVFRRHLKQHNPTASQPSDTQRPPSRLCLPCSRRNTQCDGNSPCGACLSNWTDCQWVGSDGSHATSSEQAAVMPPSGQSPALWFAPNSEAWVSQSFPVTPPYSSVPGDSNSGSHPTQGTVEPTGYTSPPTVSSAAGVAPGQSGPSNSSQRPQLTSPPTPLQNAVCDSPDSGGLADLNSNFDRTSPETHRLIRLFFKDIHPYWAIVHEPTFEVEKMPTILLATMVMLASWIEGGPEHQKLAPIVFNGVNRIRMDFHPPLRLLQAVLLYVVYATCTLTAGEAVARVLNLTGWLITTCRYLGIFNSQYTSDEMLAPEACGCPFVWWRAQEQLNRLAFSVLRVDTYLSVLLDQPPSVRYQELCIPLPKSRQLWAAPNDGERRKLQWNEPAGREKALFSFFMRDALNPAREGNLPYCLTDIDYHLSTCAAQNHIWERAREAHSSMSDEIAREIDPQTFVELAHPHLTLWRDERKEDCELREKYFSGSLDRTEHLLGPHTFTLMYISNLKLNAPLNAMRIKGHYYKSRPGSTIPTRKPGAHLRRWLSTGCPRHALWNAAQICRIYTIESTRSDDEQDGGPSSRAGLRLNPLLIPGVLMSAVVACSYARRERSCASCRAADTNAGMGTSYTNAPNPNPIPSCSPSAAPAEEEAIDLFSLGDHDPVLKKWTLSGVGVPYWGGSDERIPVCQCQLQNIAAWFHRAFAEDEGAEMEFVIFLAELSRQAQ
ncbi:hypothetical protein F5Y05DRAFT_391228 [Hypoxylon sp. FL0543]|nr:hypothetical protein F5Y05DRAFT_391228 [Hypoxylon sp. FL0543]